MDFFFATERNLERDRLVMIWMKKKIEVRNQYWSVLLRILSIVVVKRIILQSKNKKKWTHETVSAKSSHEPI